MITVKLTVADLYQRRASVEDVERQLRVDNPHYTEAEIEIRLRKYALAADMCRVSHAQTRAWNWTAAGRALNGAYLALGEEPPIADNHEAGLALHCAKHPVQKA
jgi:hypothetical protein